MMENRKIKAHSTQQNPKAPYNKLPESSKKPTALLKPEDK